MVRKTWAPSSRTGRSTVGSLDPSITKQILLQNYESSQNARDNTDATLTRIRKYSINTSAIRLRIEKDNF